MPTISGILPSAMPASALPRFCHRRRRHPEIHQPHRHGRVRPRHPRGRSTNTPCTPSRQAVILQSAQVDHYEYLPASLRGTRRGQQPRGRFRRHAQDSVQPRPLHRAGRLHGNPAAEVLPVKTRSGEVRLKYRAYYHQVRRSAVVKDAAGKVRGTPLHRRPRQQESGGPTSSRKIKGIDPLGFSAQHAIDVRSPPSTTDCLPDSRTRCRRRFQRRTSTPTAWKSSPPSANRQHGRRQLRSALPIRAPRLFHPRPRFRHRAPNPQPAQTQVLNRTITLKDAWAKIEKGNRVKPLEFLKKSAVNSFHLLSIVDSMLFSLEHHSPLRARL